MGVYLHSTARVSNGEIHALIAQRRNEYTVRDGVYTFSARIQGGGLGILKKEKTNDIFFLEFYFFFTTHTYVQQAIYFTQKAFIVSREEDILPRNFSSDIRLKV